MNSTGGLEHDYDFEDEDEYPVTRTTILPPPPTLHEVASYVRCQQPPVRPPEGLLLDWLDLELDEETLVRPRAEGPSDLVLHESDSCPDDRPTSKRMPWIGPPTLPCRIA